MQLNRNEQQTKILENDQQSLSPKTITPTNTLTNSLSPTTLKTNKIIISSERNSPINMNIDYSLQYDETVNTSNFKGKNKDSNITQKTNLTKTDINSITDSTKKLETQTKQSKASFDWIQHFPITEEMEKIKKLQTPLSFQLLEFLKKTYSTLFQEKKLN